MYANQINFADMRTASFEFQQTFGWKPTLDECLREAAKLAVRRQWTLHFNESRGGEK